MVAHGRHESETALSAIVPVRNRLSTACCARVATARRGDGFLPSSRLLFCARGAAATGLEGRCDLIRFTVGAGREDDNRAVRYDHGDRAQVRHGGARCGRGPPPLERVDLDAVLGLIRDKKYFVLHAPRQTGKTSALLALRDLLNGGTQGGFRCVYANVEAG